MSKPLYLITGATGYVGGVLAKELLRRGERIRLLVRSLDSAEPLRALGAEVVLGDLRDRPSLDRAVQGVTGIHHIGAIYRQANVSDKMFYDINVEGTRSLLDAAVGAGVSRFIHCSTGGVLGGVKNPPGSDKTPYNPGDVYQRSKVEGEKIALEYFREGKIRGVVIRPAMVYGPGDTRHLKMFKMIARKRFFYVGDGMTKVHLVDVRDLVQAFILAMEKSELNGEIYHVPGESSVPLKEVVHIIADRLGVPPPWLHLPVKPIQWAGSLCEAICKPFGIDPPLYRRRVDFFTKTRHFDGTKAARELGYKPSKPLRDEVVEVTDWYKAEGWL